MNYLAYHFTVLPPQPGSDILIAHLSDIGFESFDLNETGFIAYIQEENNKDILIDELVFEDFKYIIKIEKIAHSNWNKEWESNFEPVVVENLLCIRAPFHKKKQFCTIRNYNNAKNEFWNRTSSNHTLDV
jgi:ribosomal protein L11 methyltransferase